jgi:hypothetical protein
MGSLTFTSQLIFKNVSNIHVLKHINSLIFVPCIIRRIRYNQHYALFCSTALFYVLALTWQATAETCSIQYIE